MDNSDKFISALHNADLPALQKIPKADLHNHMDGIKVTVNTDDMLVLGQSVSDEFLNLFRAGLFSAEELNQIRLNGLDLE